MPPYFYTNMRPHPLSEGLDPPLDSVSFPFSGSFVFSFPLKFFAILSQQLSTALVALLIYWGSCNAFAFDAPVMVPIIHL